MKRLSAFALTVLLAAFTGACAQHRGYAGSAPIYGIQPAVYQETAWDECDGMCRAQIVRDICPSVPAFNPRDPRAEPALMSFETREALEEHTMSRCGGHSPAAYTQPVNYSANYHWSQRASTRTRHVTNPKLLHRFGVRGSQYCDGKPSGYKFSRPVPGGGIANYHCP